MQWFLVDPDDPPVKKTTLIALLFAGLGCGDDADPGPDAGGMHFASAVEMFEEGENAGFGSQNFPEVVLGPPDGKGTKAGGLDVLSLGVGGSIVLSFESAIADTEGADFVVFENPFHPGGNAEAVFAEIGRVAVSSDGESWTEFECSAEPESPGTWPGCAGWIPTEVFDPSRADLTPTDTGGNAFDLADIGVESARYVRITDLQTEGVAPTAGFDLDAVGVFELE